jgi:spore maturation protein CgeB
VRVVIFCHSLVSDWNHGNAHFLRGIVQELVDRDCDVQVFEPADGWSRSNLLADYGEEALRGFCRAYPSLRSETYHTASLDLRGAIGAADLVMVHEWTDRDLVARIGRYRAERGSFVLLFHDTHHRSVTEPASMAAYDLSGYDGVLAFGDSVRDTYMRRGWARRVWTWHEAADTRVFYPRGGPAEGSQDPAEAGAHFQPSRTSRRLNPACEVVLDQRGQATRAGSRRRAVEPGGRTTGSNHPERGEYTRFPVGSGFSRTVESGTIRGDVVWIGNWGDEERTAELDEFLFTPVKRLGLRATLFGVRYPEAARTRLAADGIEYRGWLPNYQVPDVFARFRATVHIPRRPYLESLPGIPTIRPFEALACGIPLVSARWDQAAGLFTPGADFLVARDGDEMTAHLSALMSDGTLRARLAARGLATIAAAHTCAHRIDQLMEIYHSCRADSRNRTTTSRLAEREANREGRPTEVTT